MRLQHLQEGDHRWGSANQRLSLSPSFSLPSLMIKEIELLALVSDWHKRPMLAISSSKPHDHERATARVFLSQFYVNSTHLRWTKRSCFKNPCYVMYYVRGRAAASVNAAQWLYPPRPRRSPQPSVSSRRDRVGHRRPVAVAPSVAAVVAEAASVTPSRR